MGFKRRKSSQREKIYKTIADNSSHPTSLQIFNMLREEKPTLSLGNVYRNIKILIEEGRIKSRDFGDSVEHYDAITEVHYHFICEQCKEISDFLIPVQNNITKMAEDKTLHIVTGHTIQFYGICNKCNKKKGGKK